MKRYHGHLNWGNKNQKRAGQKEAFWWVLHGPNQPGVNNIQDRRRNEPPWHKQVTKPTTEPTGESAKAWSEEMGGIRREHTGSRDLTGENATRREDSTPENGRGGKRVATSLWGERLCSEGEGRLRSHRQESSAPMREGELQAKREQGERKKRG